MNFLSFQIYLPSSKTILSHRKFRKFSQSTFQTFLLIFKQILLFPHKSNNTLKDEDNFDISYIHHFQTVIQNFIK